MSSFHALGAHGYRLLKPFEKGPAKRKINGVWVAWPRSPGGAALKAYPCSADKWTIGWGCTTWFDGRPVRDGDTLENEAQAEELLLINLRPFEIHVSRELEQKDADVELTPFQIDALICLAFNIGKKAFSQPCTALKQTWRGNFELAAEGFGLFSGVSTYSPSKEQVANPEYAGAIGQKDGRWIWIGPQGQPCKYMTRLDGLLRRHHAEAMLYKGLDWEFACAEGKVNIDLHPPSKRLWNAGGNRWEDRILRQTTVADVEAVAARYPLDNSELVLFDPKPIMIDPSDMPTGEVELEPVEASAAQIEHVEAVTPAPAVGAQPPAVQGPAQSPQVSTASVRVPSAVERKEAPAKVVAPAQPAPSTPVGTKPKSANTVAPAEVPYRIDANAGLKPLDESDRAKGYWYQQFGIVIIRLGSFGVFGTGVASVSQKVQSDAAISNLVLTGFVLGGVALTGYVVKKYGDWKRKRGERNATQALY